MPGRVWRNQTEPEFRSALKLIAFPLATGTVFYRNIEGWKWVDSFFFCVTTILTVG